MNKHLTISDFSVAFGGGLPEEKLRKSFYLHVVIIHAMKEKDDQISDEEVLSFIMDEFMMSNLYDLGYTNEDLANPKDLSLEEIDWLIKSMIQDRDMIASIVPVMHYQKHIREKIFGKIPYFCPPLNSRIKEQIILN